MFAIILNDETIPFYINCIPCIKNKNISFFFNKNHSNSLEFIRTNIIHLKNNNICDFYDINDSQDLTFIDLYRKVKITTDESVYCILHVPEGLNNNLDNIDDHINNYYIKQYKSEYSTIKFLWIPFTNTSVFSKMNEQYMTTVSQKCLTYKSVLLGNNEVPVVFNQKRFTDIIEKIPRKMCVVDLYKYFGQHMYGGIQMDLDVQVKQVLSPILNKYKDAEVILFVEIPYCPPSHLGPREVKTQSKRIGSCLLWSKKKHDFWSKCLDLCYERIQILFSEGVTTWSDTDILWCTGPDIITTVWYQHYKDNKKVVIVEIDEHIKYFHHNCHGDWRGNI